MAQIIRFNDGITQSGGLSLAVARNQASYDSRGNASAVNTARYSKKRALVTRKQATTLKTRSGTGTLSIMGSGVGADGSSPLVFTKVVGSTNGYRVFSGSALDQYNVVTSGLDIFNGAYTIDGNAATHEPTGAIVCHGLIAAACKVTYSGGPVGLLTLATSIDGGVTWSRTPVVAADRFATDTNYPDPIASTYADSWGALWSVNWFPIGNSNNPTEAWVTMVDYLVESSGSPDGGKEGGRAWICRATRSSATSSDWTLGNLREIYASDAVGSGSAGEHYHCCGMMQDQSTGVWYAIVIIGDTWFNRVAKIQIGSSDGSDYETATLTTVTDWSGSNEQNTSYPQSPQPAACAILPNGDLIAGADGEPHAVLALDADSLTSAKAVWYPVGPIADANDNTRGTLDLYMVHARDSYGNLYVCTHRVKEGQTAETNEESAIGSLDGVTWFNLGDPDVRFPAGPYLIGCTNGADIIGYDRPVASDVRALYPLEVRPGVTNQIPATWESGLTDDIQITAGTSSNQSLNGHDLYKIGTGLAWPGAFDASGTMPTPPGFDTNRLLIACRNMPKDATAATSASPIVITSAGHGLSNNNQVTFRDMPGDFAALNGNAYAATVLSTSTFSIAVNGSAFGAYDTGNPGNWIDLQTGDAWFKNISDTNTGDKTLVAWLHVPQNAATCGCKLFQNSVPDTYQRLSNGLGWTRFTDWRAATGVPGRVTIVMGPAAGEASEFAIMFEGAYLGRIPGYPVPYGTSSPPMELATVSGLNITSGDDYAVSVDILLPEDIGSAQCTGPLFTLYQDANNYIEVSTVDSPSGGAANGYPYDLKIQVTTSGVAGTAAYINAAYSHLPGAAIRVTVARESGDTVLYYQANEIAQQSATVSSEVCAAPVSVKLGSDDDGTAVNALEFAGVVAARTAEEAEQKLNATIHAGQPLSNPAFGNAPALQGDHWSGFNLN